MGGFGTDKQIRRLVAYYTKLYGTNDPRRLAESLGIHIVIMPLGNAAGYYKYMKRGKWIFVNEEVLDDKMLFRVVLAHELGHAVLHKEENCTFMVRHTLLLTSRIERETNLFAAHLLITDDMLEECQGCTQDQFCAAGGYPRELVELRLS